MMCWPCSCCACAPGDAAGPSLNSTDGIVQRPALCNRPRVQSRAQRKQAIAGPEPINNRTFRKRRKKKKILERDLQSCPTSLYCGLGRRLSVLERPKIDGPSNRRGGTRVYSSFEFTERTCHGTSIPRKLRCVPVEPGCRVVGQTSARRNSSVDEHG